MPELPEVELYCRYFARHALDQRIAGVSIRDPRILGETTPHKLRSALAGRTFHQVSRHGKHLFADLGKTWLHLHFGMTGDLAWYREKGEEPRFARLIFDFENGSHLAFDDMRLFGVVDLTPSVEAYLAIHHLGPDALEHRERLIEFRRRLEGRRGAIKALVMSQEIVAGVGNLYADEAFFQTGIDPRRSADTLTGDEVRLLFSAIRGILRRVIKQKSEGKPYPAKYLIPHREVGESCPRCGGEIARTVVGGRTTFYCPRHQA